MMLKKVPTRVVNILLQILAVVLMLIGALMFPLPIPLGAILMVCGLALLIFANDRLRLLIKHLRQRSARFNRAVTRVLGILPGWLRRIIQRTDP